MDDQQKWQRAVVATFQGYDRLSVDSRVALDSLIVRIMRLKQDLFELALDSGGSRICRECGGQCCLNGKYHVTVLDLLAYRSAGLEPVVPDFGKHPFCPYGAAEGCLMEPRFRSMACLIFNCEQLEEHMTEDDQQRFAEAERNLRDAVAQVEELLGYRASRALLLSLEN